MAFKEHCARYMHCCLKVTCNIRDIRGSFLNVTLTAPRTTAYKHVENENRLSCVESGFKTNACSATPACIRKCCPLCCAASSAASAPASHKARPPGKTPPTEPRGAADVTYPSTPPDGPPIKRDVHPSALLLPTRWPTLLSAAPGGDQHKTAPSSQRPRPRMRTRTYTRWHPTVAFTPAAEVPSKPAEACIVAEASVKPAEACTAAEAVSKPAEACTAAEASSKSAEARTAGGAIRGDVAIVGEAHAPNADGTFAVHVSLAAAAVVAAVAVADDGVGGGVLALAAPPTAAVPAAVHRAPRQLAPTAPT
eukprot:362958-Chlamydomonas_euryale.AAC.2